MSFSYFIACSHPLPEGVYGTRPLRVYDSYADYMRSGDYVPVERRSSHNLGFHARTPREEEKHRATLKGPFLVYAKGSFAAWDGISPILPQDDWVHEILSLPNQYSLGPSGLDPLCHFLKPDARCELLSAWVGVERLPLSDTRHIIDLSDYVRRGIDSEGFLRFEAEESAGRNAIADVISLPTPLVDPDYIRFDPWITNTAVGFTWKDNADDSLFFARAKL